jgi:hypothetical protein
METTIFLPTDTFYSYTSGFYTDFETVEKTPKNNLVTLAKREENIRFFFFFAF